MPYSSTAMDTGTNVLKNVYRLARPSVGPRLGPVGRMLVRPSRPGSGVVESPRLARLRPFLASDPAGRGSGLPAHGSIRAPQSTAFPRGTAIPPQVRRHLGVSFNGHGADRQLFWCLWLRGLLNTHHPGARQQQVPPPRGLRPRADSWAAGLPVAVGHAASRGCFSDWPSGPNKPADRQPGPASAASMQQGRAAILLRWARRPQDCRRGIRGRWGLPRGGSRQGARQPLPLLGVRRPLHPRACAGRDVDVALLRFAALHVRGSAARRLHDESKKVDQ